MKKYRPYSSGFIVLYVLVAISVVDSVYTLVGQLTGTLNEYMASFSVFSYLITAMALSYAYIYTRVKVCIDDKNIQIAYVAYIQPAEGAKRAMFIYRQGSLDMKLIDKTFPLNTIERYGYAEDLGFSRVDKSSANEKSPLFPVNEVCFLTTDGKRYHMNAACYKPKQLKDMFTVLQERTGVAPEGILADVLK